jgi:hypothetical protein
MDFDALIRDLHRVKRMPGHLEMKEILMGRAAEAINLLQSQLAAAQQQNTSLQSQLTTAQGNEMDSADVSAIDAVLGNTSDPTPTVVAGAGSDSVAAGSGQSTTVAGAGN